MKARLQIWFEIKGQRGFDFGDMRRYCANVSSLVAKV